MLKLPLKRHRSVCFNSVVFEKSSAGRKLVTATEGGAAREYIFLVEFVRDISQKETTSY